MKEFLINDRYLDAMTIALHPKTYLLANEGTIRSQKTVSMIQAFFEAVQMSDEVLHLITATDLDSIRDNILQSDFGLEKMYPKYVKRVREEIGSYYLRVKCNLPNKPKIKKILLVGFNNKVQWKKINGKTLGCILGDEINTADPIFVRECFNRQTSVKHPKMFWTLNGDYPKHFIYTEFINHCTIIGKDRTPASIVADMDKYEKKKGYYYLHWNMEDNPIMTEDLIERAKSLFPVGSYYYRIKLLGERGVPGRLIYIDYLSSDLIQKVDIRDYPKCTIGVDIGATQANNAFVLTGFSHDFSKGAFVDKYSFKQTGYEQKTIELIAFVKSWLAKGANIEGVYVDSQEANYIRDLKTRFKTEGLPPIIPSYKATIKERIDMNIILFSGKRFVFNDTPAGKSLYDSFMIAKWVDGKEGEVREDNNEAHIDDIDSAEYSQTPHMKKLLAYSKMYEKVA